MDDERRIDHEINGESALSSLAANLPASWLERDRRSGVLAERQHGVVARWQLLALGLSRGAIEHRLKAGRLHPVHHGVYALGHRQLDANGHWMAAALACGPDAVISHRSAAALWGIRPQSSGPIEVTVAGSKRLRAGIRAHRRQLPRDEVTESSGIPLTSVPRTLLDLATVLSAHRLERAFEQAETLRLTDPLPLPALLDRYPRRRGVARLRAILEASRFGERVTRGRLEEGFLELIAGSGLPSPSVNVPVRAGGRCFECDFVWRSARLIAELDGYRTHGTRLAFERDRTRDRLLQAEGWSVVRITWLALQKERSETLRDLRRLLSGHPP